jgi:uncharacterized alpha-E superfamily protein
MRGEHLPLLSRVADSVYWMGRYIERAENVARFIGVNLNLQIDLPLAPSQQWQPLVDTSGDAELFKERFGLATQAKVIEWLAYDTNNLSSIASCLRFARENARSVRETISSEMWAQVNSMYLQLQTQRSLPEPERMLDAFREIRMGCHLFEGVTDATMSHNEAWHFMRLGRMLERADKTSRILDVKYFMLLPSVRDVGTPYDDTGTPIGAFRYRSEQLMGQLRAELDFTSVDTVIRSGLHEYLDRLQLKMNGIDNSLRDDFAVRGAPMTQTQTQTQTQTSL